MLRLIRHFILLIGLQRCGVFVFIFVFLFGMVIYVETIYFAKERRELSLKENEEEG